MHKNEQFAVNKTSLHFIKAFCSLIYSEGSKSWKIRLKVLFFRLQILTMGKNQIIIFKFEISYYPKGQSLLKFPYRSNTSLDL